MNIYIRTIILVLTMEAVNPFSTSVLHGIYGERAVERLLSCEVNTNSIIDMVTPAGCPLEIKTAARWIKSNYTTTRRRRGRFNFRTEQHQALLENTGYYALCLLDEEDQIIGVHITQARDVYHPSLTAGIARVSIPWTEFFTEDAA